MLLELAQEMGGLHNLDGESQTLANYDTVLESIQDQINAVQNEIRAMIVQQSKAPDNLQGMYNESIADAGDRLEILETRQSSIENQAVNSSAIHRQQKRAMQKLEGYGDKFWEQSDNEINQGLYETLGIFRLICIDGHIEGKTNPA